MKQKLYLRNKENFCKEAQDFYEQNFDLMDENEADIVIVNDFQEASYPDKVVARNSTGLDGIVAKEVVSLRGEDLSDLRDVSDLTLSMAIYTTRIFKGESIRGKTMGIIGMGRLGKQLAELAKFMGMEVIYCDK